MFHLDPFQREDFPLFAMLAFNERVMGMNLGRVFSEEEAAWFFDAMIAANKTQSPPLGWHKVFLTATGEYIGLAGLSEADEHHVEIEYMLLPEHWGKGYATRLVADLLAALHLARPNTQVAAMTDPSNASSIRVLEKNGFRQKAGFVNEDGDEVCVYVHEWVS